MPGFGSLAPDDVDWSRMNQPFGQIGPRPEDQIVIPTSNPRVQFTQGDLDKANALAMGFSGGGLATKAVPLAMDEASRMARAVDQGFDTSTPVYHGTSKDVDFNKFKAGRHGIWTTTDPAEASSYAKDNDSQTVKYEGGQYVPVNQAARVFPLVAKPLEKPFIVGQTGDVPDNIRTASNYKKAQSDWFDQLKAKGHDGVDYGNGVRVDFDANNLRSRFAKFDPTNVAKASLLGGLAGVGMLGSQAPRETP